MCRSGRSGQPRACIGTVRYPNAWLVTAVVFGLTVGCSGSGPSPHAPALGADSSSAAVAGRDSATTADQTTTFSDLERGFDEGADNVCTRGTVECIDAVITEM